MENSIIPGWVVAGIFIFILVYGFGRWLHYRRLRTEGCKPRGKSGDSSTTYLHDLDGSDGGSSGGDGGD